MATISPRDSSAMTPGRVTRAIFDEDYYDLSQSLWGGWQFYDQIAPGVAADKAADGRFSSNLYYWASGAWTLRPLQMELGKFCETTPGVTGVLGSSSVTTITGKWSPSTTYGVTDLFFRKDSANVAVAPSSLSPSAAVTALPTALGTMTVPMDPILKTNSNLGINQAICVRFVVDGLNRSGYDWIGAVCFGQYAIGIRGDGWAEVWEYGTPRLGGSAAWGKHGTFRYSKPNQVIQSYHQLIIFPHVGPTSEKYIAFASANLDAPQQGAAGLASNPGTRSVSGGVVSSEYLHRWDETRTPTQDSAGGGGNVTTAAKLWILERRNVRACWQVSHLVYAESGQLLTNMWGAETNDSRTVSVGSIRTLPASTSIGSTLKDGLGATVTTSTAGNAFYIQWDFAGPKTTTPILWAYKIHREAQSSLRTMESFTTPGTDWRVQSGISDPRTEQAFFRAEDRYDDYPRLRTRAELPCRIVVTDSSGETPVDVNLFRGAVISPLRTKLGIAGRKAGMSGIGDVVTHPTSEWSQYQCTAAGMWHRLQVTTLRTALSYQNFAYDSVAGLGAQGQIQGWKITDAIEYLLKAAGFPSGMINIPSLSMRFKAGIGTQDSDRILEPSTSIAEMIVRLCRNYLGRFLVFDANQGDYGKWTLVGAPSSTTPLAAFVGGPDWTEGDPPLPGHCLSSYPAGTAPTFGRRESYFVAPDHNHLVALTIVDTTGTGGTRVDNHLYNYLSYHVPGATVDPDPDSPHFLGYERGLILADPSLWAGSYIGGWEETQKTVDFVLMRLFAFTCMARERTHFKAPLLFITDPATSARRPLRFYDVVTLDGEGWYVRSCTPDYRSDRLQTAEYELERLVEYKP